MGQPFSRLRQPNKPIPEVVAALTGITNEMVAGQIIDPAEVASFAASAALIVAHNAGFDRKFAERFCDVFMRKPWACSMSQVPWAEEGFEGTKLGYLLAGIGLFFDGHRATEDRYAALELLSRPLPRSGKLAFANLLAAASRDTYRVWADRAPYATKDILKARGYRWYDGAAGGQKAWYFDVPEDRIDAEVSFLRSEIFGDDRDVAVDIITAVQRYSDRALLRQVAAAGQPANDT
ncbi:MAG: 3'-5' exonuclease [Ferrovibrionaceae bacterium]